MAQPNESIELERSKPAEVQYVEQNVSMVQQYATARIQSAYTVAARFPRNIEAVRQDVLKECQRPSFCAPDETKNGSSLAIYRVPRGNVQVNGKWVPNLIAGPTIRFAEMMLRAWRYLSVEVNPLGEDDEQKLLQVVCTDYQSCNFTTEMVTVPKRIERKKPKPDDVVLGQRTNSYGDNVFTVVPTDDELAMKQNALVSKARRNLILQMVPGWLIEEGMKQCRETAATKDAQDPDAARRGIFDSFATVGVTAEQLAAYIGHNNPKLNPAELDELRGLYSGIREGFTTWSAVIAAKEEGGGSDSGQAAQIDKLFEELEYTPRQRSTARGKYATDPGKLLEWLAEQVAKKRNDGGTKQAAAPVEQKPAAPVEQQKPIEEAKKTPPPPPPAAVITDLKWE
jgi:hypothetical protein